MSKLFSLWFLFLGLSWQQKDPLNDFCRRFGHQTALIDSKLYIDGGLVDWNPISQNDQNYTNTWLLYNDLTTSPQGINMPQLYANLSKNASIPDVSGGVLWADEVNKRFYLYGGDYNDIQPNTPTLLSYDVINNNWDNFGPPDMAISSVSWGGGVGISELGQGYMLGGWLSNASVPGWSGGPIATSTLIKYEMDTGVWTNNTGPDDTPRAEGVMVYVPASTNGLLVYFGGVTAPYNNATIVESPMDTIYIYDIASTRWYTQTATGEVPPSRRRFCAGASWAADQSSYNIYLYGGLGFGANYSGFDDVYILTLPSFKWINWWEGSNPPNPHNSLTCNVVNKGQMLVIGGTFPLTDACDSAPTWGTHNMDLGKLSGKSWNNYELNITSYSVPPEVVALVGGSSSGGATATAPAAGFNNSDLSVYFSQHAAVASRSPTRSIPTPTNSHSSKALPTGAIAGIAVGGAITLVALIIGICCFCRRHRRQAETTQTPVTYNAVPPQSPPSHYTDEGQYQPRYQLPANPPPVELPESNYQMHQVDPKIAYHVDEQQHPIYAGYTGWNQQEPSPTVASPHPSTYSGVTELSGPHSNTYFGSQTSPAPTYSSAGRGARKPLPNQTYYSP